jgi:hypothetical protein
VGFALKYFLILGDAMIEKLLAQMVAEFEDPDMLVEQGNGQWQILFDEKLTLELQLTSGGEQLLLKTTLGYCPEDNEGVMELLLANLLGEGTFGAILGLDESGSRVQLLRSFPSDLTYRDFRDMLEQFISAASYWMEKLPSQTAASEVQELAQRKTGL